MPGQATGSSVFRLAGLFFVGCFVALLMASSATGQTKAPQSAAVENNKMGPYKALAQLAYSASQKGDNANAAMLAKILERVWDKSEDYGGDTALSKTNKQAFNEIDKAMDEFVMLFVERPNAAPDPARVKAAYNNYIEKLKLGD
jgi:hypothetical protein